MQNFETFLSVKEPSGQRNCQVATALKISRYQLKSSFVIDFIPSQFMFTLAQPRGDCENFIMPHMHINLIGILEMHSCMQNPFASSSGGKWFSQDSQTYLCYTMVISNAYSFPTLCLLSLCSTVYAFHGTQFFITA